MWRHITVQSVLTQEKILEKGEKKNSDPHSKIAFQIARYSCLIVKYANDIRYNSESIATHDKQTLTAISARKLSDLADEIEKESYDVIGIDEGQFFPDIVEFCEQVIQSTLHVQRFYAGHKV